MAQQFYIIILEEFFMTPILSLHNIDVVKFLAVLDTCEGNVFLVTNEGDRLNLKSKLCQIVGLTKLIEGGKIAEASIIARIKTTRANSSVLTSLATLRMQRLIIKQLFTFSR